LCPWAIFVLMNKDLIYQQSIDILTSQWKFHINLGLERVQKMLQIIENPEKSLKIIHVAGTNGKGSVSSMLSSILGNVQLVQSLLLQGSRKSGAKTLHPLTSCSSHLRGGLSRKERGEMTNLKVGLFTSPHIFEYTERIKINGNDIEKEIFAQKILQIVDIAEKNKIHLTEFEILAVVAFDYFAENNVDIVVLETGLGGRLDATNVIKENLCSIITHIDLDHTERLGDTIEKIAFEKAGIIKENCHVVISSSNAGFEVIKKVADEKNASIYFAEDVSEESSILKKHLALKGTYQEENLALVLAAVEILRKKGFDISQDNIEQGLKKVKHPCRFEYVEEHNMLIDGAHNPNGARALRESLDNCFPNAKFRFIFGCLNNKKYPEMMKNLFTQRDEIYFYEFDSPNACDYEELLSECEFSAKKFDEFHKDNTLTVICGSFYMIKELLEKMGIK